MFNVSRKKNERGIGLLELMLSLAIIAILLVMATRYFLFANENQKINNAISMVHGIAGGAAHYFIANQGYATMTIPTLVAGKYVPSAFGGPTGKDGNGKPTGGDGTGANPWGGNIVVGSTATGYTVTLTSVPVASCTKIANMLTGEGHNADCKTDTGSVIVTL